MTLQQATGPHIPTWTVGERLRKAREDAGYTQEQLAQEISVSKRQIIHYERNEKMPTRGDFVLWQFATQVPIEWLKTGHTDPDGNGTFPSKLRFGNLQARITPLNRHVDEYAAA
jgi:transcriptional regulator with XRE-family HTH domain